jgi:hypothetical protein
MLPSRCSPPPCRNRLVMGVTSAPSEPPSERGSVSPPPLSTEGTTP